MTDPNLEFTDDDKWQDIIWDCPPGGDPCIKELNQFTNIELFRLCKLLNNEIKRRIHGTHE